MTLAVLPTRLPTVPDRVHSLFLSADARAVRAAPIPAEGELICESSLWLRVDLGYSSAFRALLLVGPDAMLLDLAAAVPLAFGFDEDHGSWFTMPRKDVGRGRGMLAHSGWPLGRRGVDDVEWSASCLNGEDYWGGEFDEGMIDPSPKEISTESFVVDSAVVGHWFWQVFDWGDEWHFGCRPLAVEEPVHGVHVVIEPVNVPDQYEYEPTEADYASGDYERRVAVPFPEGMKVMGPSHTRRASWAL